MTNSVLVILKQCILTKSIIATYISMILRCYNNILTNLHSDRVLPYRRPNVFRIN